jgi:hypothetical protein
MAPGTGRAGRGGHAPTRGLTTELIEGVHAPARPELLEDSTPHAHIVTRCPPCQQEVQQIGCHGPGDAGPAVCGCLQRLIERFDVWRRCFAAGQRLVVERLLVGG